MHQEQSGCQCAAWGLHPSGFWITLCLCSPYLSFPLIVYICVPCCIYTVVLRCVCACVCSCRCVQRHWVLFLRHRHYFSSPLLSFPLPSSPLLFPLLPFSYPSLTPPVKISQWLTNSRDHWSDFSQQWDSKSVSPHYHDQLFFFLSFLMHCS